MNTVEPVTKHFLFTLKFSVLSYKYDQKYTQNVIFSHFCMS